MFFVKVFFEILAVLLIAYATYNEDKLIKFEDELIEVAEFVINDIRKQGVKQWIYKTRERIAFLF